MNTLPGFAGTVDVGTFRGVAVHLVSRCRLEDLCEWRGGERRILFRRDAGLRALLAAAAAVAGWHWRSDLHIKCGIEIGDGRSVRIGNHWIKVRLCRSFATGTPAAMNGFHFDTDNRTLWFCKSDPASLVVNALVAFDGSWRRWCHDVACEALRIAEHESLPASEVEAFQADFDEATRKLVA